MALTADELLGRVGLYDPVPIAWAEILTGIKASTIRQWKRRGHVQPAGLDEFGRPMYRGIDILRAEATTSGRAQSAAQA